MLLDGVFVNQIKVNLLVYYKDLISYGNYELHNYSININFPKSRYFCVFGHDIITYMSSIYIGANRGQNQQVPHRRGIKAFCYGAPKICPDWGKKTTCASGTG